MVLVYLAFRQLMFKKANLIFMLLAIGFGLGFQWPNIANLTGYSVELIEKFVTKGVGHFIVYHKDRKGFITNEKLYQEIRSLISTKSIYARIRLPGLITEINETSTTQSVEILGMEKEEWELITNVPFFQPKTRHIPEILIGKQVKDATGFKDLPLVLKIVSIYNKKPIILKAKAVFVPEYGYSTEKQLILPLHILQKAIQRKNWITELGVISYSNFPKQTNDKLADPNMRTLHWSETNDFVRSAIRGNQILVIISSFMVMLGVAIPIMALLYIGVLEDRRNIALLSSLGVYKYKIFLIYFFRALLVAVLGCALGVLLGYGLLKYFLNYPIYKTPSFTILPVVSFYDFVYSVLIVFGVVLISGIYPAIRAYNLNPVVIFREE
ncbi:MAG: FtsX-like permease family protein [Leptospiraceae bacterium]|nr:FtsX-like permease family protein [Leptospiraceae bacterium]MCP5493853.1 FtsX-like permease family protein [Leptospiraceae bacterium]